LKAKLKGIYEEDKLKFDYNLINIKSFFLNKKFNGNFVYDFKKEQIDLKNKDMVYPFDFSYNFKTTNMAIKGNFIEPISFGNEVIAKIKRINHIFIFQINLFFFKIINKISIKLFI
jgi:hypothetical protein